MRTAGFYSFRRFSLNFQHCCVSSYSFGLARSLACGQLDSDHNSQTEDKQEEEDEDTSSNASIKLGQFVGLVNDNSTYTQHRVWIAQVKSPTKRPAFSGTRKWPPIPTSWNWPARLKGIPRQPHVSGNAGQARRFGHLQTADLTSRHPQSCRGLTLVFFPGVPWL